MSRIDNYAKDHVPRINKNLLRIERAQPGYVANPKPLAIKAPPDPILDLITKLEKKFTELAIQVIGGSKKRPKANNQQVNMRCSNCQGHGHLPPQCPYPITRYKVK